MLWMTQLTLFQVNISPVRGNSMVRSPFGWNSILLPQNLTWLMHDVKSKKKHWTITHVVYLWIHGAMENEITAIISSLSMEGRYRRVVAHLHIRGSNCQPIHQNSGGNSFAAVESAAFLDALASLEEAFVTHSVTDSWFLKPSHLSLLFGLTVGWFLF